MALHALPLCLCESLSINKRTTRRKTLMPHKSCLGKLQQYPERRSEKSALDIIHLRKKRQRRQKRKMHVLTLRG